MTTDHWTLKWDSLTEQINKMQTPPPLTEERAIELVREIKDLIKEHFGDVE